VTPGVGAGADAGGASEVNAGGGNDGGEGRAAELPEELAGWHPPAARAATAARINQARRTRRM
jgi:hypothetical protein